MSKKIENQSKVNNSNETLNQKPFDVLMNEEFGNLQNKGFHRNWFIPIVKDQTLMDELINYQTLLKNGNSPIFRLKRLLPNTLVECNEDTNGNISSIYVLYSKGGKLYRVVSKKEYGIVKSRMELKNNKYVPYEKCELQLFSGKVDEFNDGRLVKSVEYKDGVRNGESYTYYVDYDWNHITKTKTPKFEKTTYKKGKLNGEYLNTKTNIKGSYLNTKKNGVWTIYGKQLLIDIKSSYTNKYDINGYEVGDLITKQLPFSIYSDSKYQVYYVNDILNGEFNINEWRGEFKLGLINGQIRKETKTGYYSYKVESINYVNGLKEDSLINYTYDEDYEDESVINITKYKNGNKNSSIILSTNNLGKVPQELTSLTSNYLNQEVFNTLLKNNMNLEGLTKDDFLNNWIVLEKIEFDENNSILNKITIDEEDLKYTTDNYFSFEEYLVKECGYPYFKKTEYSSWTSFSIKSSTEIANYYDLQPKVYSLSINDKPKQLFILDDFFDEKIDNKLNPIVLKYQKEVWKHLSDLMKLSYEDELKNKEMTEKFRLEEEIKMKEEQGLSVNSFPID